MRYKTIIELICEANDKEDAVYTAGEYLRGNVDSGVRMRTRTSSLKTSVFKRSSMMLFVAMFVLPSLFLAFGIVRKANIEGKSIVDMLSTSTVQPRLNVKDNGDFKREWEKKKDERIMEYLKK